MENKIITISGMQCYEKDGTAYLNLETVARGLGFTHVAASGNEVVRWDRVSAYMKDFGVPTCGHDSFIPENIFYRLAMKAKNAAAEAFQAKVADEIIPSIRKTGGYGAQTNRIASDLAMAKRLNAESRKACQWLKAAKYAADDTTRQECASRATAALNNGVPVIPMPCRQEKLLTATEVGEMLHITSQRVGAMAIKAGLKTEKYGQWFQDKSRYSDKQVQSFRYNLKAVEALRDLLEAQHTA